VRPGNGEGEKRRLGDWEKRRRGEEEKRRRGDWEIGRRGDWEIGRRGDWEDKGAWKLRLGTEQGKGLLCYLCKLK
jgi:hypothetical protein